ncbi:MAG: hypothetical protein ACLQNG_11530 [Acidimicrobiales bacterium]
MKQRIGRDDIAWKRLRKRILDGATHCAICHKPLRFDAPPRSRWSPSVDHIIPLHGHVGDDLRRLAHDPNNCRAVHLGCNARRGNRQRSVVVQKPRPKFTSFRSRSW